MDIVEKLDTINCYMEVKMKVESYLFGWLKLFQKLKNIKKEKQLVFFFFFFLI